MKPLAAQVPAGALAKQLSERTRITRFKDLEVHMFQAGEAPDVVAEIGRIREQEYRHVGAGRGVERDIDRFDTEWPSYLQIVSFDRAEGEVVAMYRAIHCGWALERGGLNALRTTGLFEFSEEFVSAELPRLVELGRSVVNRSARRAVQGLFSVWAGLGALVGEWSDIIGFFGNVSVYRNVSDTQLDTMLGFLYGYHGDTGARVRARSECAYEARAQEDAPTSFDALIQRASRERWSVPPILVSYLKASPGMIAFDTAIDHDFGGAREIAIMVPTDTITEKTRTRFIDPYVSINPERFRW